MSYCMPKDGITIKNTEISQIVHINANIQYSLYLTNRLQEHVNG